MIQELKLQLLSDFDKQLFCADLLKSFAGTCTDWFSAQSIHNGLSAKEVVHVYTLREICINIESWMESLRGISTDQHDDIERSLSLLLRDSIEKLDDPSIDESMSSLRALIVAFTNL